MNLKEIIIDTLKKEVVPAMGCTEPVAVALACAKAKEIIKYNSLKKVEILVSPNIYKNGLCVGIPNTNEIGLDISGALGITGGKCEKDLRVLEGLTCEEVVEAKKLINENTIMLGIKDTSDKVYVEVILKADTGNSKVVIRERHNNFVYLESNGEVLLQEDYKFEGKENNSNKIYESNIREIIQEIDSIEYEELKFLYEGLEMNEKIAETALVKKLGMGVGSGFYENMKKGIMADDLINNAMMYTAAAADARMSGLNKPVMSSNGSGNNGLTAILPLVAYTKKYDVEDEKIVKALAISHVVNCYIKNYIGRLSALCGCGVAAATGASAAIAWLMGGSYDQIDGAIKNMVANLSGMICDGAKVGCALKLATAGATAVQSAILAINDSIVPTRNGIIAESAEETIRNLGTLGNDGMTITDKVILGIMQQMKSAV